MSDDVDLEELKQRTQVGNRNQESAKQTEKKSFREDILEALSAIENGDRQKTVSFWDGDTAALVSALENNPDVQQDVGTRLQEELGRDVDEAAIDRSEVLRLAMRAGLQRAAPDIVEIWLDAKADSVRRL
ncbi:hypothetical protein [Haladaptatus halobius]|uniref:hypothetical protein n=1 Tax=Haladaptatus halobius TaxID=2884875 RepID=UPI001D0AAC7F|nr:hypothetical protein [Haladaptatus halobius]